MSQPLKGTPRSRGEERGCPICDTLVGTEKQTAALHVVYRANLELVVLRALTTVRTDCLMPGEAFGRAALIVDEFLAKQEGQ